jgi:glycosyltransferase involved in cell wall biosynthesis
MKQGFLIPVYNHGRTVGPLAEKLSGFGLPIILVDDGSDSETKAWLERTVATVPGVFLVSLKKNTGKGGAVSRGIDKAREFGLTHVLQIDADGQHDIGRAAFFLEQSALHPEAVICGYPEFDESAPRGRVIGREISNFWAAIVTISGDLRDVMCGFRVYPVEPIWRILHNSYVDKRMGFDVEILVRLYWAKVPPIFYPIKVTYPKDGISNFHLVRDNLRIAETFFRLFGGMLIRLPRLLLFRRERGREGQR